MDDDFYNYVRAQRRALLRLAFVLTGDGHVAEDVVQEVFVRAHRRWDRIRQVHSPHAYVRRMVVNEVRTRQRRRRVLLVFRSPEEVPEQPFPDTGLGALEREVMWSRVLSLPPRQRAVLVLRYFEDLPDREIAEALSVSPVTVRSNASRALAALRADPELARYFSPVAPAAGARETTPCDQET